MGLSGVSIWQLLIILFVVLVLFGTRRLKGAGEDLGNIVRSFRKSVQEHHSEKGEASKKDSTTSTQKQQTSQP